MKISRALLLVVAVQACLLTSHNIMSWQSPPGQPNKSFSDLVTSFYDTIKDSLQEIKQIAYQIPNQLYHYFVPHHAYEYSVANVRFTQIDDIPRQEKKFLKRRTNLIYDDVQKFIGVECTKEEMPRIGLCFSGGGFRSSLMSMGFLQGAQECGLLQTSMYMAGLSGSSYTIAPWIISDKPLDQFRNDLACCLKDGINHISNIEELQTLLDILVKKGLTKQMVCVIDVFGSLMANTFLHNRSTHADPLKLTLSDTHRFLGEGFLPLPVYTAIDGSVYPYEWLEFTPFEIGFKNSYIPTWAYGRKFKNGESTNFVEEQTLGYYMGIFGSAYAINLKEAIRMTIGNLANLTPILPEIIKPAFDSIVSLVMNSPLAEERLFPAVAPNFCYQFENSPRKEHRSIEAADAGIDFNVPLPPLLRKHRGLDMIVIYDASENLEHGKQLFKAQDYAQRHDLPFPKIDYTNMHKNNMSIFRDEDNPDAPVIVYFPRIKNEGYSTCFDPEQCLDSGECGMFSFDYEGELFDHLCDLPRFTIKENINAIKQELAGIIERKRSHSATHATT